MRDSRRADFEKVYKKPHFDWANFLVYTKTRSSEMKFFNQVQKTFSEPINLTHSKYKNVMKYNRCIRKSAIMKANAEKRAVEKRDFVIAYGDGG